jgi:hypothetical protein
VIIVNVDVERTTAREGEKRVDVGNLCEKMKTHPLIIRQKLRAHGALLINWEIIGENWKMPRQIERIRGQKTTTLAYNREDAL